MFKTKKYIVFFAAALMLTAGCKIFDTGKTADPKKDAKKTAVKKDANAKKAVNKDVKAKKKVKAKKVAKPKKAAKSAKGKKVAKAKKKDKTSLAPAKNHPTNYEKAKAKNNKECLIGFGFCTPLQFPSEDTTVSLFRFFRVLRL